MAEPFVWGAGGVQMTPERILAERKVAQALMERGMDFSPVEHWTQGAARVAQAISGSLDARRLDAAERANIAADRDMIGKWFGGGATPAAPVMPTKPAAPVVMDQGGPAVADAQGVYGADAVMMPPGQPNYRDAIASIESAGNKNPYGVMGPVTDKGDRAYGRYQVMGSNIGPWTKEHLGRELTPEQFLADPAAQDTVFDKRFGTYVAQTGNPQDAAAMWFSGRPMAGNTRQDQLGTSVPTYVQKFTKALSPATAQVDPAALPPNATPTQGYVIPGQPAPAAAAPASPFGSVNPGIVQAMMSPYTSEGTKKVAAIMLQHQMGDKVQYQTLPDGTILQLDPYGRVPPKPIYQAPTKPTFGQTGESAFGEKQFGFIDPITKTITPASGAAAGTATGVPGADSSFMAKGVTAINHELKGQEYLDQFAPEVQSAVRNYIDGKSTPTGNPRKGFTQAVKMISQKYGEDIGQPADDVSFAARRTMRNQLSSAGPGTMGGQINFGNTAMGHLADLSHRALELDNSNGWGFAPLASAINSMRGLTTEQAAKVKALEDAAQHYGQEITKFYAGSPGGEAERNRFMTALSGARSPKELAAVIEQEAELIPSRLSSITGQIKTTLGEQGVKEFPVIRSESQEALKRVSENVRRLRSGTAPPSATGNKTSTGVTWSVE